MPADTSDPYAQVKSGAKLIFAAPFLPTVPGTDTYVDQLR